jgi:hypothetical protein
VTAALLAPGSHSTDLDPGGRAIEVTRSGSESIDEHWRPLDDRLGADRG